MKLRKIRKGIVIVVAASALGLGCELIVDFDRTKIPIETSDSATPTGDSSFDATVDTFRPDTFVPDAADAAADTAVDAAADAEDAADGD
jgi:hypothetical protein